MGSKKLNTEEFIRLARLIHGDKYDYSQVKFVKSREPVNIICPTHGLFLQRPSDHLRGCGCKECGVIKRSMGNTLSTSEFIAKAKAVHGDKYDYSKVVYVHGKKEVVIVCKECGQEFKQTPHNHLSGYGCPYCGIRHRNDRTRGKSRDSMKKVILGVGINDYELSTKGLLSYKRWANMLRRCYDKEYHVKKPTYIGCKVCEEWLRFSNFKKWFDENYVDGYALDKDILIKGNKVYSPETCCFVPAALNSLLTKRDFHRGSYPVGVQKPQRSRFLASLHINGKATRIGRFDTVEEAFAAYKQARETHIKEVAQKYFDDGKITKRVYDALMKYEVEITD